MYETLKSAFEHRSVTEYDLCEKMSEESISYRVWHYPIVCLVRSKQFPLLKMPSRLRQSTLEGGTVSK